MQTSTEKLWREDQVGVSSAVMLHSTSNSKVVWCNTLLNGLVIFQWLRNHKGELGLIPLILRSMMLLKFEFQLSLDQPTVFISSQKQVDLVLGQEVKYIYLLYEVLVSISLYTLNMFWTNRWCTNCHEQVPEMRHLNLVYGLLDTSFLSILFTIIISIVIILSILNNKSQGLAKAIEFLSVQQNYK